MKQKQLVRLKFRESVFERDNYTCQGTPDCIAYGRRNERDLDAHHITDRNEMLNGGYVKENGITFCSECHLKAEKFHISGGKNWEEGFHPDELYAKIGSSKEKALQSSKRLKR